MYQFRWIEWNRDKCDKHNIAPREAEYLVNTARTPYPRDIGDGKFLVRGRTAEGAYIQVIFTFDPMGDVFVIHARPLPNSEKRALRRSRR